jgi:hypothetical protein
MREFAICASASSEHNRVIYRRGEYAAITSVHSEFYVKRLPTCLSAESVALLGDLDEVIRLAGVGSCIHCAGC